MKVQLNSFNSFWKKIFKFLLILTIIVSHIYIWDYLGKIIFGDLGCDSGDMFLYNMLGVMSEVAAFLVFVLLYLTVYSPLKKEYDKNYK